MLDKAFTPNYLVVLALRLAEGKKICGYCHGNVCAICDQKGWIKKDDVEKLDVEQLIVDVQAVIPPVWAGYAKTTEKIREVVISHLEEWEAQ